MKRGMIIGSLILVLVIAIAGFFLLNQEDNDLNSSNENPIEECQNEPSQSSVDSCLKSLAITNNDASICAQMSGNKPQPNTRDNCYWQIALQTKDISPCYNIEDVSEKDSCFNVVARETMNGELCGEMSASVKIESTGIPERDYCYIDIAKATKNPSLCERIITPDSNVFWNKQKCRDASR